MFKTLKINARSLNYIKEKFQLTGTGKSDDPIIINSLFSTYNAIKFKNITSYIYVKDIIANEVRLIKSSNIIIDKCKFFRLDIVACNKIIVKNSCIFHGYLKYNRGNIFRDNIFHRDYAAVEFSEKGSKSGDLNMKRIQIGMPIALFFPVLIMVISLCFYSMIIGLLSMLTFSLLLIPVIDIERKKSFVKNLGPNKFENNWYSTLDDISPLFLKPKKK